MALAMSASWFLFDGESVLSVVHTEQLFGIEYEFTPYEGE